MAQLKSQKLKNKIKKIVARPKNDKKPITSVTVVTTTLPDIAGSCLKLLKIIGTNTPAITELIKFIIKANDINIARVNSLNQKNVTSPTSIDKTKPLRIDTANSLLKSHLRLDELICSKVRPLKTMVKVCVAATPPMLATIGIKSLNILFDLIHL